MRQAEESGISPFPRGLTGSSRESADFLLRKSSGLDCRVALYCHVVKLLQTFHFKTGLEVF